MTSYKVMLKAKMECYPSEKSASEYRAEVSLQNALNHTAIRV